MLLVVAGECFSNNAKTLSCEPSMALPKPTRSVSSYQSSSGFGGGGVRGF